MFDIGDVYMLVCHAWLVICYVLLWMFKSVNASNPIPTLDTSVGVTVRGWRVQSYCWRWSWENRVLAWKYDSSVWWAFLHTGWVFKMCCITSERLGLSMVEHPCIGCTKGKDYMGVLPRGIRKKYISQSFIDQKRNEFLELKQGQMTVTEYEREFVRLSRYARECVSTEAIMCKRF